MRIAKKLVLNSVILSLIAVLLSSAVLGFIAYALAKHALENQIQNQLVSVRDLKKNDIEHYYQSLREQLRGFANSEVLIQAARDLKNAFLLYPQEASHTHPPLPINSVMDYFQKMNAKYQKETGLALKTDSFQNVLFDANDPYASLQYAYVMSGAIPESNETQYVRVHDKYHPILKGFMNMVNVKDLWLVDPESGNIFYTVAKKPDFTLSVAKAADTDLDLKNQFEKLSISQGGPDLQATDVVDFKPYLPALDEQRGFLMAPIFENGQRVAILVFELGINAINDVMTNRQHWKQEGLQNTGETYIVGPDFRLRSMSRFFYENPEAYLAQMKQLGLSERVIQEMKTRKTSIGIQPVLTKGARSAQGDVTGYDTFPDYRHIPVFSAYAPLNIPGLDWAILSEIDVSEAYAPIQDLATKLIWYGFLSAIVLSILTAFPGSQIALSISRPIENLAKWILKVTQYLDLTLRIPVRGEDEISEVSTALNQLFDKLQSAFKDTLQSTQEMQSTAALLRKIAQETIRPPAQPPVTSIPPTSQPRATTMPTPPPIAVPSTMPPGRSEVAGQPGAVTPPSPPSAPLTREEIFRKIQEAVVQRKAQEELKARMGLQPSSGLDLAASLLGQPSSSTQADLAKASSNLDELSKRLLKVSNQFKIMEREAARKRGW